jgi:hypothetical protein
VNIINIVYLYFLLPVRFCGSGNDDNYNFLEALMLHFYLKYVSKAKIIRVNLEMAEWYVTTVDNTVSDLILGVALMLCLLFYKLYIY